MTRSTTRQFVIVANRLPVRQVPNEDGTMSWETSPGGLVSALAPAMASESADMCWVGWAGVDAEGIEQPFISDGIKLVPVPLTPEEIEAHYDGMSNGTLWPLFHDKIGPVEFHRTWFDGYLRANRRFADAVAEQAEQGATVWVHDYQLMLVPQLLRAARPDLRIGFFLHIPFPPGELFMQLPWRHRLAEGVLGADLIGFQTPYGAANFKRLATRLELAALDGSHHLKVGDRLAHVDSFPIGIDVARSEALARSPEVGEASRDLRAHLGRPQTIILGVDRLDYTKGIDMRLRAFKELLAEGRLDANQVTMVQVAEPSRDKVDAYVTMRARIEHLVSEINGDFGRVGFPVIHYIHQTQDFETIMALYRAADVMLVTPFRDGMNLVAKEYVASRFDDDGVLILSEFAGAAHQLSEAVIVNPHDIDGLKNAIVLAIEMPEADKRRRMSAMRASVTANDVNQWTRQFLKALSDEVQHDSAASPT